MPVKYEAPTVTIDDSGARKNEKRYTHPAYGVIGISRGSCVPPIQLFGSSVKHSNYISLRIKTAERSNNGDYEFVFGKELITEVIISGNQLGELLSSMNVGDGVPCTIVRRETNYDIPMIKDDETIISESRKSMEDRINHVMERADNLIKASQEMLDTKKPLSKGEMKSFHDKLAMIKQELHANLPFVAKCFDEKVEKSVQQAKAEVEAFVSSTIHSAGLDAISKGEYKVEIPYTEIKEIK
jgi:hypothetical protein